MSMVLDNLPFSQRRELKKTIKGAVDKLTGNSLDDSAQINSQQVDLMLSGNIPVDNQFDASALQNRDRSRQSYVMQMQKIANSLDYDRVSISKTPDSGAPMVFSRGVPIAASNTGRQETITMSDGKDGSLKIPSVYAVIEANELIASHDAKGNKIDAYGGKQGVMALNNGRTAALQQAHRQSAADHYIQALIDDEASHGIDRRAIEDMDQPILVRVFAESDISHLDDPGAASNTSAGAALSASEQAKTDAQKLNENDLTLYEGGDINNIANRDFVRSFIQSMGGSDAVGDMVTSEGLVSSGGIKRIESALIAKAYDDDAILNDLTENPDDDLKSLGKVLIDIAGRWGVMKSSAKDGHVAQDMDITSSLVEAITIIRTARQQGKSVHDLVSQVDMYSGTINPLTESLLRLMFRGEYMTRVRSADKIKKALHGFLDRAMTTKPGNDLFGESSSPSELLEHEKSTLESIENQPKAQQSLFDSIAEYFIGCTEILDNNSQPLTDFSSLFEGVWHSVLNAASRTNINPTEKQKQAGNYKKGRLSLFGFDIAIENPKGSHRSGKDENGHEWSILMQDNYGYFERTKGIDGDPVDVFFPDPQDITLSSKESPKCFVIKQIDKKGNLDEHKVMLGYASESAAKEAYLSNYEKGWHGFGGIKELQDHELYRFLYGEPDYDKEWGAVLDSASSLSFRERRTVKKEIKEDIDALGGNLKFTERRKVKNSIKSNILKLSAATVDEKDNYHEVMKRISSAVEGSELALRSIKVNSKAILMQDKGWLHDVITDTLISIASDAGAGSSIEGKALTMLDDLSAIVNVVYDQFKSKADALPDKTKSDKQQSEIKEEKTLDQRIDEAVDVGIVLSQNDIDQIHSLSEQADVFREKLRARQGDDAHMEGVRKHFHLGMVGGSGRNNHKLNQRRERSLDKSIEGAKENVRLYALLEAREKEINDLLLGKGTEKNLQEKAAKKEKNKLDIARLAINLKKGDTFGGKEVVRVTKDKAGYPSKVRYVDPESYDPVLEFWRINFSSKEEFHEYVDKVRDEESSANSEQTGENPESLTSTDKLESEANDATEEDGFHRLTIPTIYSLEFHQEMMKKIYDMDGMVAIDDVKAAFKKIVNNPEETKELLNKKTKKDLLKHADAHYKNEKKDRVVSSAYDRMLMQFAHFKEGTFSYSIGVGAREKAVQERVDSLTQEDLISWSQERKQAAEEHKARYQATKKAIEDPETLEDFKTFIKYKGHDALKELSAEKLSLYDELAASNELEERAEVKAQKQVERAKLQGEDAAIPHEFAETTHAKKNIPLYVVRLTERVEKDHYYELNRKAKALGGWYSKFSKNGAIPGFQFTSEDSRDSFAAILKGESVDNSVNSASSAEEREANKEKAQIEKLLEIAKNLESKGQEELDRDKLTNTARRAGMAASIEARARNTIATGKTFRAIAEKMQEGNIKFLSGITQKTQLEALYSVLDNATYEYLRDADLDRSKRQELEESIKDGEATPDVMNSVAANVKYPEPHIYRSNALKIASTLKQYDGYKKAGAQLERLIPSDANTETFKIPTDLAEKIVSLAKHLDSTKHQDSFSIPWSIESGLERNKRLKRMGIETDVHLRAAIRELASLKQKTDKADPLIELERSLIGTHKDFEFFNTPSLVATKLVKLAQVKSTHKVLEPSAGIGHIADAVVKAGVSKDNIQTVEVAYKLAQGLEMKGYDVHQGDFLSFNQGKYDRIIMNPPFSGDKDIEHVMHAYENLLAPNGRLVAIMSSMAGDRQNKKNQSFREFLDEYVSDEEMLPEKSFESSINSTNINTKVIILEKGESPADSATNADLEAERQAKTEKSEELETRTHEANQEANQQNEEQLLDDEQATEVITLSRKLYNIYGGDGRTVDIELPTAKQIELFYETGEINGFWWSEDEQAKWISTNLLYKEDSVTSVDSASVRELRKFLGIWKEEDDFRERKQLESAEKSIVDTDSSAQNDGDGLSDDPNADNYRYKDTGYIAGSRKEAAANQIRRAKKNGEKLRVTDIDFRALEENPRQAEKLITKSNIFGATDYQAMKDAGMEPGAAFLISKVYAAIGTKPQDEALSRKDFAIGLETIRERLENKKTVDEVLAVLEEIKEEMDGVILNESQAQQVEILDAEISELVSIRTDYSKQERLLQEKYHEAQSKYDNLRYSRRRIKGESKEEKAAKIEAAEAERSARLKESMAFRKQFDEDLQSKGLPTLAEVNQKQWALGDKKREIFAAAKEENIRSNQSTRSWITLGDRFLKAVHYYGYKGSDAFAGHVTNAKAGRINDWDWALGEKKKQPRRATKNEINFQLKVTDSHERVGGKDITALSTGELKELCGFRDIQVGNWVRDDRNSAKFHVEQAAAAMSDMSDILGMDIKHIGLNGRLGLAFGARGTGNAGGSTAKATYEPVERVINLTKMAGGGSLGHEWFHAIDNLLSELIAGEATGTNDFVTDNPDLLPDGDIKDALVALKSVMFSGDIRLPESIKFTEKDVRLAKYNIDNPKGKVSEIIKGANNATDAVLAVDDFFRRSLGVTSKKMTKNHKDWRKLAAAYHTEEGKTEITVNSGAMGSSFFFESVRLDGGKVEKYWSKTIEMMARAYQSWLEDTLEAQGRKNDYLSALADNKYHTDPIFGELKPYPEGEERKLINKAFDQFFKAIREEQVFEKASANKALLDSIFGGFDLIAA